MRVTPHTWRYVLPLLLAPAALYALTLQAAGPAASGARLCGLPSADRAELLLQFVGTQELQRQAEHQIDTLFE